MTAVPLKKVTKLSITRRSSLTQSASLVVETDANATPSRSVSRMDLATLLGIVAGFGVVIGSIMMGGSLRAFFNAPGIVIVLGGTLAATLISERLATFIGAARVALKAFFAKPVLVDQTINRLIELATVMRKEGILALENEKIDDGFLAKAIIGQ